MRWALWRNRRGSSRRLPGSRSRKATSSMLVSGARSSTSRVMRPSSSRYCVRLQESAGVDVVWDGEQQRSEMYAWAIAHSNGFEPRGTVRSFDNKYYSKSAATGPVSLREPYHNDEFSFLKSAAKHDLKIPITGAYTLAVWSYDEHHLPKEGRLGGGLSRRDEVDARRELTLDIARNIIRPNLEALIDLGATWIQIDEPGAS